MDRIAARHGSCQSKRKVCLPAAARPYKQIRMCKLPTPKMRRKILFQAFIAGNSGKILQIRSTPSLFPANRTLSLLLFYHKKRFLVNPCAPLLPVCTQSAFFYLTDCKNYAIIAVRKTQPGCSAIGSAPALGAGCRGFESLHSDQNFDRKRISSSTFGHFLRCFKHFTATYSKNAA